LEPFQGVAGLIFAGENVADGGVNQAGGEQAETEFDHNRILTADHILII